MLPLVARPWGKGRLAPPHGQARRDDGALCKAGGGGLNVRSAIDPRHRGYIFFDLETLFDGRIRSIELRGGVGLFSLLILIAAVEGKWGR
jgi:hypothetical protein